MKYLKSGAISVCLLALASTPVLHDAHAAPVSGYMEGWDVPGDLAGWGPNTIVTTVVVENSWVSNWSPRLAQKSAI